MKNIILFSFIANQLFGQPDTLKLSGNVAGTHTAKVCIQLDSVTTSAVTVLRIGVCDSETDNFIPGIAVLLDSCITTQEWNEDGYGAVLVDSVSFYTLQAMGLFNTFLIQAADDCGIDTFFVKNVTFVPPGDITPPRLIKVLFRAEDHTGKFKEQEMIWIRK